MQHLDVKINGSVATVLVRRPECLGALDPVLMEDLQTAFGDLHLEPKVRAVILTGGGPYFCSGLDLSVMRRIAQMDDSGTPDVPDPAATAQWFTLWRSLTELFETMLRFPKPILAAVDGPAIGAGFGLALAADIVVASGRATFAAAAPRWGIAGGGTAALLQFRLGGSIATSLAIGGQTIDADHAHRIGLCDHPVDSDQIWVAASQIADRIAESTPQSLTAAKRLINETVGESMMSNLSAAAATDASLCSTKECRDRLTSWSTNQP